jgi:hypothetical protein
MSKGKHTEAKSVIAIAPLSDDGCCASSNNLCGVTCEIVRQTFASKNLAAHTSSDALASN